ncbi:probable disease resistance protein At5g43730 [Abrus precatorius]|uniref:Probable disease resistance protein At5g43730 n=1 Tax=Abrus precatorius TaxID=3816 RepID=A0A8B8KB04_ABRPR|nr:probable disease resistance protein At5g43730 [Abrus precatorius]
MANIVMSVVSSVGKYLVEPIIPEIQYFFCVDKVIKDLEKEKKELTSERDNLLNRIERAKERTEIIEKSVEKWLNDVQNILEEVEDLEIKMNIDSSCFHGWCPTWRRYLLLKQMVEKTKAMGEFKDKSNIQPFSHLAPLPGIQYESSKNFTYFESTKMAYNQLLEALQDDCIFMIGVYGMGGSGKTTLVKEVGKNVEGLKLFDTVLLITVSQTPNIKDIQGKIADMLTLKLEEESVVGRAQRLWLKLKEKKQVLIIVDDIWEEFELKDIGIFLDNDYKGRWKVLVTTRRQEICDLMDCQKRIHLSLLSEDESWTLFRKCANIDDGFSRSLDDVPQKLCLECKGLPIALVAMGSSLKGKSNDEWKLALHSLRHSEEIDDHMEESMRAALNCLKLSYDYLKNKETKLLFLLCSIFPDDYEILIEDLSRYAFGLGLGRRLPLELARSHIKASINKLLYSSLLIQIEEHKDEEYVKMHDMIRDVALWIAKRSRDHKILVNLEKPLSILVEDYSIRDYFALSSWYCEDQISFQLDAPNLEFFLLNNVTQSSLNLSHGMFEGIQGLKVLSLETYDQLSLTFPQSTQFLTNLRTLHLHGWSLGDISFIASLTRLEVLDLRRCRLIELPNEIGKLKRLKLLDLSSSYIQEPYNEAIGKCSQLEELYVPEYNRDYLSQGVVDIIALQKLQRFVIHTTSFKNNSNINVKSKRILELLDFNISNLGTSKKNLLQIAEIIFLRCLHGGCKNIIPDMIGVVGGMNDLYSFHLDNCEEIECIFDTTSNFDNVDSNALIPRLVELELLELENLKELCRGPPMQVLHFFEKLEKLFIWRCQQLHNIFPDECNLQNLKILIIQNYGRDYNYCTANEVLFSVPVAQSLQQLEELTIQGCDKLKHIVASERKQGSNSSIEIVPTERNSHFVMPNLKKVCISFCSKLEYVFPICYAEGLAQLQHVEIVMASKLKYVFGECDHEDHSSNHYENKIILPHLEVLTLINLQNLVRIGVVNHLVNRSSQRVVLTVVRCPKLTLWMR